MGIDLDAGDPAGGVEYEADITVNLKVTAPESQSRRLIE